MNISDNERALWVLKSKGPQPLAVLATEMGVTTEGARFQLLRLAGEGLVEARSEAKGRGRPQQIWSLTTAGHARFPDSHADLTVRLIQKTRELFGEEGLQALIDASALDARQKYQAAMAGQATLEDRVRTLSGLRDREGYMARVEADGADFLLIEDHCPICAAATACQNFCKAELSVFREALGSDAEVSRVDHLLSGGRRCAYRVSPKQ
ncbi:helix-turn-helix transcriptional regulator [Siphonobacter aquaeclarae]|uniref:Transcriptional regulator n=1 Tax=Siphonobacter aquaeclarae TaxID=563176 RepID=A0A1G9R7M9_9BACT|nr:metalloregulator ArsR/SmtB family transcription factor [Siphonobacter aquaeclarae]SDM19234.1 transcriptional regulator [Siphonobacter aquaeclarae]